MSCLILLNSWGYRYAPPCSVNFFVCLVETGFLHVGQAGLELPTSGDSAASASQSAGITDVRKTSQRLEQGLATFLIHSALCVLVIFHGASRQNKTLNSSIH